jgi:hypothetical protein
MPSHRSHKRVYVNPPRHDELPPGTPGQTHAEASGERRENGQLAAGASTVPALGGKAHKGTTALSHRISEQAFDDAGRHRVRRLRRALSREYAATVGGGVAGVGGNLLLKIVAVAAEWHEQAMRRGDEDGTRKHAETIRTTLAYAREEIAKVGAARKGASESFDDLVAGAAAGDEKVTP